MNNHAFLYAVPPYDNTLMHATNVAIATGSLASRLVREERTRVIHPDGRNENVSEHSHMLAKVAYALACDMYSKLDRGKVVLYATLHDDVEAYVGDTPTDKITPEERSKKKEREARGLERLVDEWTHIVPEYAVHASLYEAQEDAEARFVRVVDKLMPLLIHIPNEGAALKGLWTFSSLIQNAIDVANDLYAQYPEYGDLINIRTELSVYVAKTYLR